MNLETIHPGVHRVDLGMVNAYLLEDQGRWLIVDTGTPGSEGALLSALREAGGNPNDVAAILVTHLHADHSGSLAALKELTGAPAWMHPVDADAVRQGVSMRPAQPAPGVLNWLLVKVVMAARGPMDIAPAAVERELVHGEVLDFAGGVRVIHAPGHAAGQVCLWVERDGGVLLAADAASRMMGLGYPPIFEDQEEGLQTLRKLANLTFQTACFGHGNPLREGAAEVFQQKWGGR